MEQSHSVILEVLDGLAMSKKSIPTRLLYDERGSVLFNEITRQPEYYPARAERAVLDHNGSVVLGAIPELNQASVALLELGASAEDKATFLLDTPLGSRIAIYIGVNLERTVLEALEQRLRASRPQLQVETIRANFLESLSLPFLSSGTEVIAFFPGSTMGQLTPSAAIDFLVSVRRTACALIVGFDVCHDPARLLPAYNDSAGANAAFNLNVLSHLNRLGCGDFDAACFQHIARWNPLDARMEMYLRSRQAQTCHFNGRAFQFAAGEPILTGVSYKRTPAAFAQLAARAGWTPVDFWSDPEGLFGMQLLLRGSGSRELA